jgi:hypothetical protein
VCPQHHTAQDTLPTHSHRRTLQGTLNAGRKAARGAAAKENLASKDSLYTLNDLGPAAPTGRIAAPSGGGGQQAAGGYDRYGDNAYSRTAVPAW